MDNNSISIPSIDKRLLAILAAFAAINIIPILLGSSPIIADSNLYLYMAKIFAGGAVPYRDFFFAHPPLLILPTALLFKIFGFSFLLGSIQPILGGLLVIYFTYLLGEQVKKDAGLLAAFLLLASPYLNYTSHALLGVSLSLGLSLGAVWALQKRPKLSGILSVLAILTRYSIFPIPLTLALFSLYKKNRAYFIGLLLASSLFLLLFLIPNFYQDTLLYHLSGGTQFGVGLYGGLEFLTREILAVSLGLIGLFFLKNKTPKLPLYILSSSLLAVLLFRSDLRPWYLLFTVPFLLIIGSTFLLRIKRRNIALAILLIPFLFSLGQISAQFSTVEQDSFQGLLALPISPGQSVLDTSLSFGSYYSLQKDARITGNLVDMVPKRFQNRAIDAQATISKLQQDPPKYVFDFHKGAIPGRPSSDSFWRNSELGDYIHSTYIPTHLTTTISDSNEHFLVLVWQKPEPEPGTGAVAEHTGAEQAAPEPAAGPAPSAPASEPEPQLPKMEGSDSYLYKTTVLTYYDLRTGARKYEQGARQSNSSDVLPSAEFVEALKSINILAEELIVPGAWQQKEKTTGLLTSKTWANKNVIFTETSENRGTSQVRSVIWLSYSPESKTWSTLEIYQNLYGNFVLVYGEELFAVSS